VLVDQSGLIFWASVELAPPEKDLYNQVAENDHPSRNSDVVPVVHFVFDGHSLP
jgi:hypothetical protein